MAYPSIATINISLQGAGITAKGFGTPLFVSSHRYFPERVRSYTSVTAAAKDLPTNSKAYKAVQAFLSNTGVTAPSEIKIGRREADLDLTVAASSTSASLIFYATDGTDTFSLPVSITGAADEDAVATAIAAAIEGDADIGDLVVASATTNVVSIDVANASYAFWVKDLSDELTETYNTTETAPEVITAIENEDSDWYFLTADDHLDTFVQAAAADIEARTKMYFVAVQEQAALTAYASGTATDILGKLTDGAYHRTVGFFHDTADTTFPECTFVGYNAAKVAGTAVWTQLALSVTPSKDPSTGLLLTQTQKGYLSDRNAFYVERLNGQLNVLKGVFTMGGQYRIEWVRGRDSLSEDLNVNYSNLIINRQGRNTIPYNNDGVNQLEGVCRETLETYVARNFVNSDYQVDFPSYKLASDSDKAAGIYRLGSFKAELSGSIDGVVLDGSLVISL